MSVLSINAGSSSIRFSFHEAGAPPLKLLDGKIERIGQGGTNLSLTEAGRATDSPPRLAVDGADWHSAADFLIGWLETHPLFAQVQAVRDRVVHGMSHASPQRVTEALLMELKGITPYDPEHLPREIELMGAEAVAFFCYQTKKWIGAFAAALGGLDTLVFAGGIGENSAAIRTRICEGLGFLGIELHAERNARNAPLISRDAGRVTVRVMHTDEESVIAGLTIGALASKASRNET